MWEVKPAPPLLTILPCSHALADVTSDCSSVRRNQEKFTPMNASAFPKTSIFEPIKHLNLPLRECRAYKNSLRFFPVVSLIINPISLSLEDEIHPNALRRKRDSSWRGGFSLGVDLGFARTGLALSKGFSIRPLSVLELRGQKLELRLLEIAQRQEVDEFIIGLPKSSDGRETPQSNKVRSVAGRLAIRAAERGCRVYLQDEYGTSSEALGRMIDMGLKKSARRTRTDAYAAVMVLERYFSLSGEEVELVLPKQLDLQYKLREASATNVDLL